MRKCVRDQQQLKRSTRMVNLLSLAPILIANLAKNICREVISLATLVIGVLRYIEAFCALTWSYLHTHTQEIVYFY